jgi:hypothetical protein
MAKITQAKIYGEGIYEGIKESLILGKRKGVNA